MINSDKTKNDNINLGDNNNRCFFVSRSIKSMDGNFKMWLHKADDNQA